MNVSGVFTKENNEWFFVSDDGERIPTTSKQINKALAAKGDEDEVKAGARVVASWTDRMYQGMVLERVELVREEEPAPPARPTPPRKAKPQSASIQVNPYTFLPFRKIGKQRDPASHFPNVDRMSGQITLDLQVRSSVAIFGSESSIQATTKIDSRGRRVESEPDDRHTITVLPRTRDGQIYMHGASAKGLVRTWVEAITDSARLMAPDEISWRFTLADRSPLQPGLLASKGGSVVIEPCTALPLGRQDAEARSLPTPYRCGPIGGGAVLHVSAAVGGGQPLVAHVFTPMPNTQPIPVDKPTQQIIELAYGASPPGREETAIWDGEDVRFRRPSGKSLLNLIGHGGGELPVWYLMDGSRLAYVGHVKGGRWAKNTPLEGKVPVRVGQATEAGYFLADLLFGPAEEGLAKSRRLPWAGRVTVQPAFASGAMETAWYSLPRMDSPKPRSAGMYLEPVNTADSVSWSDDGVRVRGTKMYWHWGDRKVLAEQVADTVDGITVRLKDAKTVEAVTSGTFSLTIQFEDLTEEELGVLLLACSLRFTDEEADRGWKVGGAKAFGFGSVINTVTEVRILQERKAALDPFGPLPYEPMTGWGELGALARRQIGEQVVPYFDDVARLDAVPQGARIAPPGLGSLSRTADGKWKNQPDAEDVVHGQNMELK